MERLFRAKLIVEQEGHGAAFCRSIIENLTTQGGKWTPRQRATLDKIIAEQRPGPAKRRATGRQPLPESYFRKKQA